MTGMDYINHILQTLETPLWGRWELQSQISAASDCAVYGLESRRMGRTETAVLKIVPLIAAKAYYTDEQKQSQIARAKERAEAESELLLRLEGCPQIVTYQDEDLLELQIDGQFEGYAYLCRMEKLESLADCIRAKRFLCSEENVLRIAKDITSALMFAHQQGITHRNIQPDKMYLSASGIFKLGGFHPPKRSGAIRAFSDSDAYIAPEIFSAKRAADYTPTADIYSLGICLYQLLNGMNLPFENECDADEAWEKRIHGDPFPMPSGASDAAARIILKACAFSPKDRYQSAEELLAALMFPEQAAGQPMIFAHTEDEVKEPAEVSAETEALISDTVPEQPDVPENEETEPESDRQEIGSEAAEDSSEAEPPVSEDDADTAVPTEEPTDSEETAEDETSDAAGEAAQPDQSDETDINAEQNESDTEPEEPVAEPEEPVAEPEEPVAEPEKPVAEQEEPDTEQAEAPSEEDAVEIQSQESALEPQLSSAPQILIQKPDTPPDAEANLSHFIIQNGKLVRYTGTDSDVTIPQGVAIIGEAAFSHNKTIQHLTIPEGVILIDDKAFAHCSALQSVDFPKSLRSIHNKSFQHCISLREAVLSGVLSQVGICAFEDCRSLSAVIFDCPIEKIGYDAFACCPALQKIEVGAYSFAYKSIEGVLFDCDCKHLVRYPSGRPEPDYMVPETVFTVEDGAFYGSISLERVKLTQNVKKVGASAFRDCKRLREVLVSSSLETIRTAAFQGCISLTNIKLPPSVSYIGTYAFSGCEHLSSVNLPMKMTELCMGVFESCKRLTDIRLPESIIKIGEKAFIDSGLQEIFVPYSTTKIEKQSFAFCRSLQNIFLSNRITQIAPNAFEGSASSMMIFGMKKSLAEDFAAKNGYKFVELFIMSPGISGFDLQQYNGGFAHLVIPPEVNTICDNAFLGCQTMRTLEIPSAVAQIGKRAFEHCDALESVRMTNLIMRIGDRAFIHCAALKHIEVTDMSQRYAPKVQRRIHRNFYQVLQAIHPQSAEAYAAKYNVTAKNTLFDRPSSRQIKKESQEHIIRLASEYENTPFLNALLQLIADEMELSERRLVQIELFGTCIIVTGIKAGQSAQKKCLYQDLNPDIHVLPDVNHMLACATVILRQLGSDFCLSPLQSKDSAMIRPAFK